MALNLLNRQFGDFVLIKRIATGGMAEVYLALKDGPASFNRLVALKSILRQRHEDPTFVAMFFNEACLGSRFNHPNLINVYDVVEIDGRLTLVMEYVDGPTVAQMAKRLAEKGEELPRKVSIRIVLDACRGLFHAHHLVDIDGKPLEVVHRDVSPQNILVGYNGQVKVFDFGIARTATQDDEGSISGVLAGKYAYMSPEQCHGFDLDERSDVFSLGIILYELTTKRRLFRRKSQIEVLRAITEEDVTPPSEIVADYPRALERIVMKALQRDPKDRPATALEMYDGLHNYAAMAEELISVEALGDYLQSKYQEEIASEQAMLEQAMKKIMEAQTRDSMSRPRITDDTPIPEPDWVDVTADDRSDSDLDLDALGELSVGVNDTVPSPALTDSQTRADAEVFRQLSRSRKLNVLLALCLMLVVATAAAGVLIFLQQPPGTDEAALTSSVVTTGLVNIGSHPDGATIFLDGVQRAEVTPASFDVALEEELAVRLEMDDYQGYETNLLLTTDEPRRDLQVVLRDASETVIRGGIVRFASVPEGALVFIDEAARGSAPLTVDDLVLGRQYQATFDLLNYHVQTVRFTLTTIAAREIRVELQEMATGLLDVVSDPEGANVSINGHPIGPTPLLSVPLGSEQAVNIVVTLSGYETFRETVQLTPDDHLTVTAALDRREDDVGDDATGPDVPTIEIIPEDEDPYELLR